MDSEPPTHIIMSHTDWWRAFNECTHNFAAEFDDECGLVHLQDHDEWDEYTFELRDIKKFQMAKLKYGW